jgi:sn-glycerol 3-phosphate transport system substrate-binding protein
MEDQGIAFDEADYVPAVISYYSDTDGNMLSLPFNSSTPVMWVNVDLFEENDLEIPTTWDEVIAAARALKEAGVPAPLRLRLAVLDDDRELLGVARPADRPRWRTALPGPDRADDQQPRDHRPYRPYPGHGRGRPLRLRRPSRRLASAIRQRRSAMWINSSAYFGGFLADIQDFEFTQAPMPLDTDVRDEPQNSIIGGATLWVLRGHEDAEYACTAQFLNSCRTPSSRRLGAGDGLRPDHQCRGRADGRARLLRREPRHRHRRSRSCR